MARILITGMSGAGKSTLLAELARRGHLTIDTDYDGWLTSDGVWDEHRMADLLADQANLVVAGTAESQGCFYDRFAHVVLLSAPLGRTPRPRPLPHEQPVRKDARATGRDPRGGAFALSPEIENSA